MSIPNAVLSGYQVGLGLLVMALWVADSQTLKTKTPNKWLNRAWIALAVLALPVTFVPELAAFMATGGRAKPALKSELSVLRGILISTGSALIIFGLMSIIFSLGNFPKVEACVIAGSTSFCDVTSMQVFSVGGRQYFTNMSYALTGEVGDIGAGTRQQVLTAMDFTSYISCTGSPIAGLSGNFGSVSTFSLQTDQRVQVSGTFCPGLGLGVGVGSGFVDAVLVATLSYCPGQTDQVLSQRLYPTLFMNWTNSRTSFNINGYVSQFMSLCSNVGVCTAFPTRLGSYGPLYINSNGQISSSAAGAVASVMPPGVQSAQVTAVCDGQGCAGATTLISDCPVGYVQDTQGMTITKDDIVRGRRDFQNAPVVASATWVQSREKSFHKAAALCTMSGGPSTAGEALVGVSVGPADQQVLAWDSTCGLQGRSSLPGQYGSGSFSYAGERESPSPVDFGRELLGTYPSLGGSNFQVASVYHNSSTEPNCTSYAAPFTMCISCSGYTDCKGNEGDGYPSGWRKPRTHNGPFYNGPVAVLSSLCNLTVAFGTNKSLTMDVASWPCWTMGDFGKSLLNSSEYTVMSTGNGWQQQITGSGALYWFFSKKYVPAGSGSTNGSTDVPNNNIPYCSEDDCYCDPWQCKWSPVCEMLESEWSSCKCVLIGKDGSWSCKAEVALLMILFWAAVAILVAGTVKALYNKFKK